MSQLARDLLNRGLTIANPFEEHQEKLSALQRTQKQEEEDSSSEEEDESDSEEESDDEDEVAIIMPRSSKKTPTKSRSLSSGLDNHISSLLIGGDKNIQPITGSLTVPYISGRWEIFDRTIKAMKGYVMLRMSLHPGADSNDIEVKWLDAKTITIKIKWPIWMQESTMLSGLDMTTVNSQLFETYPEEHNVYNSFGVTTKSLEAEDGNIYYQENVFKFKQDMDIQQFKPEIFEAAIDKTGRVATILQILFAEAIEKKPFMSPTTTKRSGGSIKFSKLPGALGKRTSPNPKAPGGGGGRASTANGNANKKQKTN